MKKEGKYLLIIASFNIQNKYTIKNYNGKTANHDFVLELKNFIYRYNLHVLACQEVVYLFQKRCKEIIHYPYLILGDFRFPKFFFKKYNESLLPFYFF